jgi:3-methylfumaryl-CoA hydratase
MELPGWVGREERRDDILSAAPVAAWRATLDHDNPSAHVGDALPPLAHWMYFQPGERQSALGVDGHPQRGGFLPPVPLPRRMWASGRIDFLAPLRVGDAVTRRSRIESVREKGGRSGALVFVGLRHEIVAGDTTAIVEEQDIVYRAMPAPDAVPVEPVAAPRDEQFSRNIVPDPVLLFRYSALTFNAHRIHYDRHHAQAIEGYPGLVVHGPLVATLLLDLLRREHPQVKVAAFSFRAVRPLFDGMPLTLCGRMSSDGRSAALWARDAGGWLAMQADASLA